MKVHYFFYGLISCITVPTFAQYTGNLIWNSNNRFQMNETYRKGKAEAKYLSAAPTVDYYGNTTGAVNPAHYALQSGFEAGAQETVLNIRVIYNAKPSAYMAIFHINQAGKKISEMDTLVSQRINKFIELSGSLGIPRNDFFIDVIALVPIFKQGEKINKPKGFELQKNIHVKYKDPSQLDRLFSMAAQCEIYDLIKVEYLYDEAEKVGVELRAKALSILQAKTEYFKKIGVKVDTAQRTMFESGNIVFPIDRYTSYQPLSVNSLDDEDKPSSGTDMMKTAAGIVNRSTVFYNPADCSGFDAVINPNPLEPPIQFTYTLQVRYRTVPLVQKLVDKQVEKQHEILIITPGGEIKTINR